MGLAQTTWVQRQTIADRFFGQKWFLSAWQNPSQALWNSLGLVVGLTAAYAALTGVSYNLYFFALSSLGLALAMSRSLRAGAIYSLVFFCFKTALWRLAYHLDSVNASQPQIDLLRFSGGMFLGLICLAIIVRNIMEKRTLLKSKVDILMALFIGISALAIFNPHTSLLLGLAGFERNVFPTMFLFFVGREVIRDQKDYKVFIRVITLTAIVTLLYGLKHALTGIWEFETTFLNDYFDHVGHDGWLTVGINGVEFRNFSTFFGYMEFTFTLALWGVLALSHDFSADNKFWRILKWTLGILTAALLGLSLERTPMLMIMTGLLVCWYLRSEPRAKVRIALVASSMVILVAVSLVAFQQELEETGVAKLQRIAEMGDPSSASSIDDRVERMWKPTMRIIMANPMGVGLGHGSETLAREKSSSSSFAVQPHNELLQKALETGWLGAGLFLALLVSLFVALKRSAGLTDNKIVRNSAAAGAGLLIAFVLCGQINLPFSGAQGCFFWFSMGALLTVTDSERIALNSDSLSSPTEEEHERK